VYAPCMYRVGGGGEPESGSYRAIVEEVPVRDVPVPTCLELADEAQVTVVVPERNAAEVAPVVAAFEDRGWRSRADPPALADWFAPVGLETGFAVLPVSVGGSAPALGSFGAVLNVEDRDVRAEQDALSSIVHVAQLDPRAIRAR
jgi:hypothetical protein